MNNTPKVRQKNFRGALLLIPYPFVGICRNLSVLGTNRQVLGMKLKSVVLFLSVKTMI